MTVSNWNEAAEVEVVERSHVYVNSGGVVSCIDWADLKPNGQETILKLRDQMESLKTELIGVIQGLSQHESTQVREG